MSVLAVDPGEQKCGIAVLTSNGEILHREIVSTATFEKAFPSLLSQWNPARVLIGNGTFSKQIQKTITPFLNGIPLAVIDEHDSTYRARQLYFKANPPRGIWRFIPLGLQVPPKPYDDFAAVLIALRFLEESSKQK